MDIRVIDPTFAVSPQIEPADCTAIAAAGYTTLICNRPDGEVPPGLSATVIAEAAKAAGLTFVDNPVNGAALTMNVVETQGNTLSESSGPVLAYCASGTRSAVVWALSQAGTVPTGTLIEATARAGYAIDGMRPQIDAVAAQKSG